jgi:hypothetical protein
MTASAAAMSAIGTSCSCAYSRTSPLNTDCVGALSDAVIASWNFATRCALTSAAVGKSISVSRCRVAFSIALSSPFSRGVTKSNASPLRPARPVRPIRWT